LVDNAILLVEGKIDKHDDRVQIIVEDAKSVESVSIAEEIKPVEPEIEEAWFAEPIEVVPVAESVELLQMVIVKFTPQQVKNTQKMNSLKCILQELSNRGKDAGVSVGGIVIGKYSCQPLWMSRQLWVENGEETVSRLKSAGFEACVFSANNHADVRVFREMRSHLNLHSWASRLVDADRDRLNRYLHYLAQLNIHLPKANFTSIPPAC
jgi:DNA polymerase-3 subunit alpha